VTIRGIAFPFGKSPFGLPAPRRDSDVIADNISRIIQTPRGSRVMRPDDGSDTHAFVFESNGPLLRARVDHEIRRAVSVGEPRARILRVDVFENKKADGEVENVVDVTFEALGVIGNATASFSSNSAR